ncbi:hypothetical protein ACRBEV_25490 [Methylobacterium phyllosphaerae]
MGQERRLDEDQILQVAPLAQELHVVDGGARKILILEPDADEGMTGGQHEHRVQPGLFEAGSVEQREIQAGSDLALQHVTRAADLLARLLEASRRQHIGDAPVRECRPDRLSEFPGPRLLPGRVAVQTGLTSGVAEFGRSVVQDDIDRRIIGSNKGGE